MLSVICSPQEEVKRGQESGLKPLPLPLPGRVTLGQLLNVSFLRRAGQAVTHPGEGVVGTSGCPAMLSLSGAGTRASSACSREGMRCCGLDLKEGGAAPTGLIFFCSVPQGRERQDRGAEGGGQAVQGYRAGISVCCLFVDSCVQGALGECFVQNVSAHRPGQEG